jgi:hypothetical protein
VATADYRFTVDSRMSAEEFLARIDDVIRARKGRLDVAGPLVRIYSLGSPALYRAWGAWWPRSLFPIVADVTAGPRATGSTVDIHLESAEGWYLFYVQAFFRHANRAFRDLENGVRRAAAG